MNRSLAFLSTFGAPSLLAAGAAAQAVPAWVQFSDQTATRLVSAPGLGTADPQEKDVAVGDIDNDGDDDVVVVRKFPFTVAGPMPNVLFINDNGVMTDMTASLAPDLLLPSDSRAVEIVDLDGDGWLDVVVANTFSDPPDILMNQGTNGSGLWAGVVLENWRTPPLPIPPRFCGLGVGDFSGDGMPDIFFADYLNTLEDRIWLNDGTGVFTDMTTPNLPAAFAESGFGTSAFIGDVDGDGDGDLVRGQAGSMHIVWNSGTGSFNSQTVLSASAVYDVGTADLDNDGDLDMYFCQDPQDQYELNPGGLASHNSASWSIHQFSMTESANTGGFNANPHFADVDGDGDLDVGVSDVDVDVPGFSRRFSLLRNNYPSTSPTLLSNPYGAIQQNYNQLGTYDHNFLDVNGDGWLDLWISFGSQNAGGVYSGGNKIFIQTPRARLTEIGTGCAGTNGVPAIGTNGPPQLGNALFQVTLGNALPGTIAIHFLCLGQTNLPFGPCTVYADLFATLAASGAVVVSPGGQGSVSLPIPLSMAIVGATLYEQWAVLDPLGPVPVAGGIALTAGLKIEAGI